MMPDAMCRHIVGSCLARAHAMPPHAFSAFLCGGIVANIIGNLPDEYWREMMRVEACGRPGCDCHVLQEQVMQTLDAMRKDHKKNVTKKGGPCDFAE